LLSPPERNRAWLTSAEEPTADQGWRPSTLTQKFRPERVLCRSSVESGTVRKLLSPVLMSPLSVGVMDESNPASLQSGKYSRLMWSGFVALNTSLSPVNRHHDFESSDFLAFMRKKVYHFLDRSIRQPTESSKL